MPDSNRRHLTLYVQSKKALTSFYRPPVPSTTADGVPTAAADTRPVDLTEAISDSPVLFLSDDQARCAALVEETAHRRGYMVHVVDVEKAGRLERLVAEHLRSVQHFPVLIAPSGARLEGQEAFTEENLSEIMPTELAGTRAFTFVKIKGGDLDRIRELLESFAQVKEIHLLTGDWDVFVVLEFPGGTGRKREVLDFVTAKIRGIPEVVDTSTIVPEFSITKFPASGRGPTPSGGGS